MACAAVATQQHWGRQAAAIHKAAAFYDILMVCLFVTGLQCDGNHEPTLSCGCDMPQSCGRLHTCLLVHVVCVQQAEAAELAKLQAAKEAALAQKEVQMQQLEQLKTRILDER